MKKQKLTKEQLKKLKQYYDKIQEAEQQYNTELRRLKIKKRLDFETDQFLYGK